MKRIIAVLIIGISIMTLNSCIRDPKEKDNKDQPPASPYLPLDAERDNVLFNLEKAYNERNIDRYDELLDNGFVFHFSNADVKNGNVSVDQWDRASEIGATNNMFDPNFSKPGLDPVSSIDLDLIYSGGDDRWIQVTPEDQVNYPNETWYEKTVRYRLTVTAGDTDYVGLDIQASFVLRWAEVEGKSIWRLIAWRDDTES